MKIVASFCPIYSSLFVVHFSLKIIVSREKIVLLALNVDYLRIHAASAAGLSLMSQGTLIYEMEFSNKILFDERVKDMPNVKFAASAIAETPTRTLVTARHFKIIIDEPVSLGGADDGPNPVEYVLAAVSGCLNVVGHIIAAEMGFELNGLTIEAEGVLDPARFMGKSLNERAGYKEIRIKLKPETNADKQVLEKWKEAVSCPVSDNLVNATPVSIMLS